MYMNDEKILLEKNDFDLTDEEYYSLQELNKDINEINNIKNLNKPVYEKVYNKVKEIYNNIKNVQLNENVSINFDLKKPEFDFSEEPTIGNIVKNLPFSKFEFRIKI